MHSQSTSKDASLQSNPDTFVKVVMDMLRMALRSYGLADEKNALFSVFLAYLYDSSAQEMNGLLNTEFAMGGTGVLYQNPYEKSEIIIHCSQAQAEKLKMKYPLLDLNGVFDFVSLPAKEFLPLITGFSDFLFNHPRFMQDKRHYLVHLGQPQKKIDLIFNGQGRAEKTQKSAQSLFSINQLFLFTLFFMAESSISRLNGKCLTTNYGLPLPGVLADLVSGYLDEDAFIGLFDHCKDSTLRFSNTMTCLLYTSPSPRD